MHFINLTNVSINRDLCWQVREWVCSEFIACMLNMLLHHPPKREGVHAEGACGINGLLESHNSNSYYVAFFKHWQMTGVKKNTIDQGCPDPVLEGFLSSQTDYTVTWPSRPTGLLNQQNLVCCVWV